MAKLPPGELSKTDKGYRLTSGWYVREGRKRPKVFWLGQDKDKALLQAQTIRWMQWVVTASKEGWTDFWLKQLKMTNPLEVVASQYAVAERTRQQLTPHLPQQVVMQQSASPSAASPPRGSPSTPTGPMLHAALDAFVESVRARSELSHSHRKTTADSIAAIKHYQPDAPLKDVDYAFLEKLAALLKDRPTSRRTSVASGEKSQIKPYTVRRLLKHLQQALTWLHRQRQSERFGEWRMPEDASELLTVNVTRIMTKAERDHAADGPSQITVNEIVHLYKVGIGGNRQASMHQMWFLTALFAGLGQTELSTIRREEFDLDAATLIHRRNKTSVQGRYWIPPELTTLLKDYFKKHEVKPGDPVFRTRAGQPVVTPRSDAVRQAFDDWRETCRKAGKTIQPGMTFYSLRRFFGDYATRVGGDAVGDAALAHTAKSVRAKHYSGFRDFDKVREVGEKLHAELTAAGMFDVITAATTSHPRVAFKARRTTHSRSAKHHGVADPPSLAGDTH